MTDDLTGACAAGAPQLIGLEPGSGPDGMVEYAFRFTAIDDGVRFDLWTGEASISLTMARPDAKRACEALLAAYGDAFHRTCEGV